MGGRVRSAFLAVILVRCGPSNLEATQMAGLDGFKSVIVISEKTPVQEAPVYALDVVDGVATFPLLEGVEHFALAYPHDLSVLQLSEGPVEFANSAQGVTRHLPTPQAAFELEGEPGARSWSEVDPDKSTVYRGFLISERNIEQCVRDGGCFSDHPYGLCTVPCPAPSDVAPPIDPEPPALPEITCPESWELVSAEPVSRCNPFPDRTPDDCSAPAEIVAVGQRDCLPVGGACPSGPWAEDLPAGAVYVDDDAASGGDGSIAAPFSSIQDALAVAVVGTTVGIAKGGYRESLEIPEGVRLVGACALGTLIQQTGGALAAVSAVGPNAALERVTLEATESAARVDLAGASLSLTSVILSSSSQSAAVLQLASGTMVTVRDSSTRSSSTFGVVVSGVLDLERSQITGGGLLLHDGGAANLADSVIAFSAFPAIHVYETAELTMVRSVVWSSAGDGITAHGTVAIEDSLILGAPGSVLAGAGLTAQRTGTIRVSRTLIERQLVGVAVYGHAELNDVTFEQTEVGVGTDILLSEPNATLTGSRLVFTGERTDALKAYAGTVDVEDVTISRAGTSTEGFGLSFSSGARATVRRANIRGTGASAVYANAGAKLQIDDVNIANTGLSKRAALYLNDPSTEMTASRVAVSNGFSNGLASWTESAANVSDLRILDSDHGGVLASGGSITLDRAQIDGVEPFGMKADGAGSEIVARDVSVSTVEVHEVGPDPCSSVRCLGLGISANSSDPSAIGRIALTRFLIEKAALGVDVAEGALIELRDGVVRDNDVGAFVTPKDFDVRMLLDGVDFVGNGQGIVVGPN